MRFSERVRFFAVQLLIIAVILGCIETVLRLRGYPYYRPGGMPHPVVHHKKIPNVTGRISKKDFSVVQKYNSFGVRDRERAFAKPKGVTRVLLLGDSFVEGAGVREPYMQSELLQRHFDSDGAAAKTEVISAGIASYSPILEYLLLKKYAYRYEPDIVVLYLDWGDIRNDNWQYGPLAKMNKDGELMAVHPDNRTWRSYNISQQRASLAITDFFINEVPRFFNGYHYRKNKYLKIGEHKNDRYMILRDEYFEEMKAEMGFTQSYILCTAREAEALGAKFLLVLYPMGVQVNGNEWSEGRTYWGFEKGKVYGQRVIRAFEEFADRENIDAVNVTPEFKISKESPLFYPDDGHFTEKGAVVAADAVYPKLKAKLNA